MERRSRFMGVILNIYLFNINLILLFRWDVFYNVVYKFKLIKEIVFRLF